MFVPPWLLGSAIFLIFVVAADCQTRAKPWDKFNLSPSSRVVRPANLGSGAVLSLKHSSYKLFDFGKEVGGIVTLSFGDVLPSTGVRVGISFSESTNYASCPSTAVNSYCLDAGSLKTTDNPQIYSGDTSNGGKGPDSYISMGTIRANGTFTANGAHLRGGFRYLNVFSERLDIGENTQVEITDVAVQFTPAPLMGKTPNAYLNHFYSSDELLNRIWYASAYTIQMCLIDPNHGRVWPPPSIGWDNSKYIGFGKSILVDGAKRDRTIWPGDMGISTMTAYTTLGDLTSSINSLATLYSYQNSQTGQLPYVGPMVFCLKPFNQTCDNGQGNWHSDMYHLWALKGTYDAYQYNRASSRSLAANGFFKEIYKQYKFAVLHSLSKIKSDTNLFYVDQEADWQRQDQGGENIAANCLLYQVLIHGTTYAKDMDDDQTAETFESNALKLKRAINTHLWNETVGAYSDNPANGNLFPQDGNSMAVWFNVTRVPSDKVRILDYLKSNWNNIGSVSPEWKYNGQNAIGTFPSSMEVLARLAADLHTIEMHGDEPRHKSTANDGIDLIKRTWGYMLDCKNSTESTFWEGFAADGQFAFNGIYMSHAHGWATGPAPALTHYLVGIQPLVANDELGREDASLYYHYTVSPQILGSGVQFVNGSLAFDHAGTIDNRDDGCSISVEWKNDSRQVTIVVDTTLLRDNYIGKLGIQFHGQSKISMRQEGGRDYDEGLQAKVVRVPPRKYKYGERVWFRSIKSGFRHVFQYDMMVNG